MISVELEHPVVVIPRSSVSEEGFVADLGRIKVLSLVPILLPPVLSLPWSNAQPTTDSQNVADSEPLGRLLFFFITVNTGSRRPLQPGV